MQTVEDKLVVGAYRPAKVFTIQPSQTISTTASAANPSAATTLVTRESGAVEQSRTKAIAPLGGGLAALGTMPEYGQAGGSVVVFDTTTNATVTINHGVSNTGVIPNQTVQALTSRDGVLYGGSNIQQGWGNPVATEAQVFTMTYSPDAGLALTNAVTLPNVRSVFGITFTTTGKLYALVTTVDGNHVRLLRLDPASLAVLSDDLLKWRGGHGTLRALTNGGLAVEAGQSIMAVDTNGPSVVLTPIATGIWPIVDGSGKWYYGRIGTGSVYVTDPGLPFRGIPTPSTGVTNDAPTNTAKTPAAPRPRLTRPPARSATTG